jgi:DNA mismatch repair protein MutS
MGQLKDNLSIILKEQAQFSFLPHNAKDTLCSLFNLKSLASFGIEDNPLAIGAAGGLISFIRETQKEDRLSNITRIQYLRDDQTLFLDYNSQKNLELLRNQSNGDTYGTLFQALDHAQTPMGTRLLKTWILQPLISKSDIDQRLEYTTFFVNHFDIRGDVRSSLGEMGDLTRLITRINYSSTANARDLLAIKRGLQIISKIRTFFTEKNTEAIKPLIDQLEDFADLIQRIEAAIHEQPPITITEGGIIKDGYNAEVDEYRDILHNGKDWIIRFEEQEKKRLGLTTGLKVQYNRVLGYFIQLTDNAFKSITLPDDYSQRQSLKNALRYDTPRLKEMETKILSAEENAMDLEYRLFQEIRKEVQQYTLVIQQNAEIIAQLDVLSTFAEVAQNNHYCRPSIESHQRIVIKQGRHPVVEILNQKEAFVPNDTLMDNDSEQILIITGPNWSGKSTYLRQTALIVLMAQMGCYVPAASAEIGIVDRIFTRIGASDDLTRGQSTFMLEMTETAQILNYATPRSLIIIDELGRGTGTVDGESIAQAVITFLHDMKVKTLFSTHFHKLITIKLPRIHNYHFKIIEKPETRKLVFLRQLTDGGTDKSYGIHVAMMAGLPAKVTDQAFCLLESALNGNGGINPAEIGKIATESEADCSQNPAGMQKPQNPIDEKPKTLSPLIKGKKSVQTSLFPIQRYDDSELVILLRSADLDNMTPIQAFEFLAKLKEKIRTEKK